MEVDKALTRVQKAVEVRRESFMCASLEDALAEAFERPLDGIAPVSTLAGGDEPSGVIRAVTVIEYQ